VFTRRVNWIHRQPVRNTYKFNRKVHERYLEKEGFITIAMEQYEIFNRHRLKQEAREENLADDPALKKYLEEK
jgi:hypothetical protein